MSQIRPSAKKMVTDARTRFARHFLAILVPTVMLVSVGSASPFSERDPANSSRGWLRGFFVDCALGPSRASGLMWMTTVCSVTGSMFSVRPLTNLGFGFSMLDFNGPSSESKGRHSFFPLSVEVLLLSRIETLEHEDLIPVSRESYVLKFEKGISSLGIFMTSLWLYASGSAWAGRCHYPFIVEELGFHTWYVKGGIRLQQMLKLGHEPLKFTTLIPIGLNAGFMVTQQDGWNGRSETTSFVLLTLGLGNCQLMSGYGWSSFPSPLSR